MRCGGCARGAGDGAAWQWPRLHPQTCRLPPPPPAPVDMNRRWSRGSPTSSLPSCARPWHVASSSCSGGGTAAPVANGAKAAPPGASATTPCRSRPGSVSVPVLSKHTTSRWPASATAAGLLTKMSCVCRRPTAMAVATVRQAGRAGGTAMVIRSRYLSRMKLRGSRGEAGGEGWWGRAVGKAAELNGSSRRLRGSDQRQPLQLLAAALPAARTPPWRRRRQAPRCPRCKRPGAGMREGQAAGAV